MSNIKRQVFYGVIWSAVQKYSTMVVSIVVTMVMARILTPSDFGVIAIAMVIISFLTIFSSMGIGPAIIQRKDLSTYDIENIYSFTFYVAFFLTSILFIAAWPISVYYDNNVLKPICQILCINVFFSTINMVPNSLMLKNKRFREMALATFFISISTGIISIVAIFLGLRLYSLLVTPILTAIGLFFYNRHYYPLKFTLHFSISPLRKIMSYSIYQFAFQFVGFISQNVDKLIIGKYMSSSLLGYYDKSHALIKQPMAMFTGVVSPILHPFLSDFQNDIKKIENNHNLMIKFLSTFSFPLSSIMWFCGNEIVLFFFGSQWGQAVLTFQILSLSIPTTLIISTSGAFWQSTNSTKYLFWVGLLNSLITIIGYVVTTSLYGTIEAIAMGYVITCIIIFFITYKIMYACIFRDSLSVMMRLLINPIINVFILSLIYVFIGNLIKDTNIILSLLIKLILGCIITISYIQISGRYDIIQILKERIIGRL